MGRRRKGRRCSFTPSCCPDGGLQRPHLPRFSRLLPESLPAALHSRLNLRSLLLQEAFPGPAFRALIIETARTPLLPPGAPGSSGSHAHLAVALLSPFTDAPPCMLRFVRSIDICACPHLGLQEGLCPRTEEPHCDTSLNLLGDGDKNSSSWA